MCVILDEPGHRRVSSHQVEGLDLFQTCSICKNDSECFFAVHINVLIMIVLFLNTFQTEKQSLTAKE